MLPFFTDFMSLIGAIGFTPMDFVLPQFLWIAAYKPKGFGCALLISLISGDRMGFSRIIIVPYLLSKKHLEKG